MAPNPNLAAPKLTKQSLPYWLQFLAPKPDELKFAQSGFLTTLWEAVLLANKNQKPILLWAMNGHPMACT